MENEVLETYLKKVNEQYRTGIAKEHAYRGALGELVNALLPQLLATNEPVHVACGAPDFAVVDATKAEGDSSTQPQAERVPPERVFDYIYAVLHTPEYRSKYKEFLKVDFPRIPYPKSVAVFDKLVAYGKELRNAHLLKDKHSQFEKVAAFAVEGENVVEGVRYEDGRVFINATQYFDKVPEDIFNFSIGGYQPAQKWLKDRKGRALTNNDCDHYQSIILALIKTRDVMAELSKFSSKWL